MDFANEPRAFLTGAMDVIGDALECPGCFWVTGHPTEREHPHSSTRNDVVSTSRAPDLTQSRILPGRWPDSADPRMQRDDSGAWSAVLEPSCCSGFKRVEREPFMKPGRPRPEG